MAAFIAGSKIAAHNLLSSASWTTPRARFPLPSSFPRKMLTGIFICCVAYYVVTASRSASMGTSTASSYATTTTGRSKNNSRENANLRSSVALLRNSASPTFRPTALRPRAASSVYGALFKTALPVNSASRAPPKDRSRISCFIHERIVSNDNVVQWDGRRFQIPPQPKRFSFAGAKVQLCESLRGSIEIYYRDSKRHHAD